MPSQATSGLLHLHVSGRYMTQIDRQADIVSQHLHIVHDLVPVAA